MSRLVDLVDTYVAEKAARGHFNGQTPRTATYVLRTFIRDAGAGDTITTASIRDLAGHRQAGPRHHQIPALAAAQPFLAHVGGGGEGGGDGVGAEPSGDVAGHAGPVHVDGGVNGKGGHQRVLPVSDETWDAVLAYLREHPTTAGPLIRSYLNPHRGVNPAYISTLVGRWMSDAGVKQRSRDGRSAHALRHTAATDMLRAGAHLRDVQQALGHASLSTTQKYLPWVVGSLKEAMSGRTYDHSTPRPLNEIAP
jgi:integrase-like protein